MNETELFRAALKLSSSERSDFLAKECPDKPELRSLVESLLQAHFESGGLLVEQTTSSDSVSQAGSTSELRAGVVVAGRYRLIELIGEGGMGSVWLAEQLEPVRRKVAMKVIKAGMGSKSVLARFDSERQALALMDHPNIAKIFDGGVTQFGQPFFVMEYVKGIPLTEYCDQAKLSLRERLKLFIPVCNAIQHAHQKGILHRDIKPSNILACLYDGQPVPKVIDFGLAKALHQPLSEQLHLTVHGIMMGTPLYMSPEQAEQNNLDVDTRSDIYSLGVLLYELLTGTTPMEKQEMQTAAMHEVVRWIREVQPPKPSTRVSDSVQLPNIAAQRSIDPASLQRSIRGDLDWIVMKALEKERTRRYDSATSFGRDLERFLDNEMVEACPPSMAYRFRKFASNHRAGIAASIAFLMLLLAGTIFSTAQYIRAKKSEAKAVRSLHDVESARLAAQSSQATAVKQLHTTQDILQFFERDLLALAAPTAGLSHGAAADPNILLRTAIDQAAAQMNDRFADNPGAECQVRIALGEAYRGLGLLPAAEAQLQRAWILVQEQPELDPETFARLVVSLAIAQMSQGKFGDARSIVNQSLTDSRHVLSGEGREAVQGIADILAQFPKPGSKSDANISSADMMNQIMNAQTDPKNQEILRNSFGLMSRFFDQANSDDPKDVSVAEKELVDQLASIDDSGMAELIKGMLAISEGKLDVAREQVERSYATIETRYGPDHPNMGMAAFVKGALALHQDRNEEAEKLLRDAIRIQHLTETPLVELPLCHTLLGRALTRQKRFAEAETALFEAFGRRTPPPENSLPKFTNEDPMETLSDPLSAIVDLYTAMGNTELAAQWKAARKN